MNESRSIHELFYVNVYFKKIIKLSKNIKINNKIYWETTVSKTCMSLEDFTFERLYMLPSLIIA